LSPEWSDLLDLQVSLGLLDLMDQRAPRDLLGLTERQAHLVQR
jgi:hypothetical protein